MRRNALRLLRPTLAAKENNMESTIVDWLLRGDVSIQYQVYRDLLQNSRPDLQERIAHEGWGARFLSARNPNGTWGRGFYQPKWTCSHYTLLDLKSLQISPAIEEIRESINIIADNEKGVDGGINPSVTVKVSDVCVNGMFLNYACYFGISQERIYSVVDFILEQRMKDGGLNCLKNRCGATHSSLHSTLSLLEGILEYLRNGYAYRVAEMKSAADNAREFLLCHRLFLSDRTGEIIHKDFLKLSFPGRWKFDILRALDYFRDAGVTWDERMEAARNVLLSKQRPEGCWALQARHPGQVHFEMEKPGTVSRWNTLRALRVLRWYNETRNSMTGNGESTPR